MTSDNRSVARLDPVAFAGSIATTALRFGAGVATEPRAARPPLLLELYEFEACPFCRIVREGLTELDLDALIRPCPKGGVRFRDELAKLGGKLQFPFLVDPNTGKSMYESADIIVYLYEQYGGGERPLRWRTVGFQQLWSGIAGTWRFGAGRNVRAS